MHAAETIKKTQGEGAFVTVYDEAVIVCEASLDDICIEPGINRDGMAVLALPLQALSR